MVKIGWVHRTLESYRSLQIKLFLFVEKFLKLIYVNVSSSTIVSRLLDIFREADYN